MLVVAMRANGDSFAEIDKFIRMSVGKPVDFPALPHKSVRQLKKLKQKLKP
jgi:hypothetical protein